MPKVKVTIGSKVKLCLTSFCSHTTEANLIKLHRKIKHNETVCHAHDFGFYAKVKVAVRSEVKIMSLQ